MNHFNNISHKCDACIERVMSKHNLPYDNTIKDALVEAYIHGHYDGDNAGFNRASEMALKIAYENSNILPYGG